MTSLTLVTQSGGVNIAVGTVGAVKFILCRHQTNVLTPNLRLTIVV